MTKRRRKWTRARRLKHAATMAAKREAGLPKTLPPVILQYHQGRLRVLRLQEIQAYVPEPENDAPPGVA